MYTARQFSNFTNTKNWFSQVFFIPRKTCSEMLYSMSLFIDLIFRKKERRNFLLIKLYKALLQEPQLYSQ